MSFRQLIKRDYDVTSNKLTKLRHDLKVAEEETMNNTQKESYEMYLEQMLTNATDKHEKELQKLKEDYERKVRQAEDSFARTKAHCESQLKGIQERKQNTPRIRKLRAEIKITEEDMIEKRIAMDAAYPKSSQPSYTSSVPLDIPTPPPVSQVSTPPAPVVSGPKKKRVAKTVAKETTPVHEETIGQTSPKYSLDQFAKALQHGDFSMISIVRSLTDAQMKETYGFTFETILERQAKLFPIHEDEESY